jgi:hypothetical protein
MVVAALGYLNPHVRNVEDELPDVVKPDEVESDPDTEIGEGLPQESAIGQAD